MKTETIVSLYFVWLAGLMGYMLGAHAEPPLWYQIIPITPFLALPFLYALYKIRQRLHR